MQTTIPWLAYPLLMFPRRLRRNLAHVHAAAIVPTTPTLWQLALGVLRMWHRMLFRPETVGYSADTPIRDTWRARLLALRPLRFAFLIKERAIAPWDMTGLVSSADRITAHLLGAFHASDEFIYDLEILACYPGALHTLQQRAHAVVHDDTPRSRWLRDLCVYEGYHEGLLARVNEAVANGVQVPADMLHNPDYSLRAYLNWCAAQPLTPAQTWRERRRGNFRIESGLRSSAAQPQERSQPQENAHAGAPADNQQVTA